MSPYDPYNPIGGNNFDIGRPLPKPPSAPRKRRAVPEVDDLFAVQKAMVKAVNSLRNCEHQNDPDVSRALERMEGGYKRMRTWLSKHGNEGLN